MPMGLELCFLFIVIGVILESYPGYLMRDVLSSAFIDLMDLISRLKYFRLRLCINMAYRSFG